MKWNVFYDNDVGLNDEGFWEWWKVMDSDSEFSGDHTKLFKCDSESDAVWLANVLNKAEIND